MNVLITGGSGFIGGALCVAAMARQWKTMTVSRSVAPNAPWTRADLRKPLELDFNPDVVVHAAARSSPWGTRREFEAANVTATENILQFCRRAGLPHLA